jgi:hypothetical protein
MKLARLSTHCARMEQQQRQHAAQLMHTCHDRRQRAEGGWYGFSVLSVAWSPDGSKIVNAAAFEGNGYHDVLVWSSRSGSTLLTLTGHREKVISVAWSPDGSKIATASEDDTARVWSSSNGSMLSSIKKVNPRCFNSGSVSWTPLYAADADRAQLQPSKCCMVARRKQDHHCMFGLPCAHMEQQQREHAVKHKKSQPAVLQ